MKKLSLFFVCTLLYSFCFAQEKTQDLNLAKQGTYSCGKQPKQVVFSPDGNYIVLPLLEDNGFDVFSCKDKKIIQRINPPQANKQGFAEGIFIEEKGTFLVSQMTTAKIYEYEYNGTLSESNSANKNIFTYKRQIDTLGNWSKFIAWSKEKNMLAVSNWLSNDISFIDYDSGKVLKRIKAGKAPRGLYFINEGKSIIALSFESGDIFQVATDTGKTEKSLKIKDAAMRHIDVDKEEKYAYISDMFHRCIYKLDLDSFKIIATVKVFNNPNTIKLYKNRFLFVSCRGPNNPKDYTKPSPENGKIMIIDTKDMSINRSITGGNQPTGLDISPDSKFLCFSNFQDAKIELYSLE